MGWLGWDEGCLTWLRWKGILQRQTARWSRQIEVCKGGRIQSAGCFQQSGRRVFSQVNRRRRFGGWSSRRGFEGGGRGGGEEETGSAGAGLRFGGESRCRSRQLGSWDAEQDAGSARVCVEWSGEAAGAGWQWQGRASSDQVCERCGGDGETSKEQRPPTLKGEMPTATVSATRSRADEMKLLHRDRDTRTQHGMQP